MTPCGHHSWPWYLGMGFLGWVYSMGVMYVGFNWGLHLGHQDRTTKPIEEIYNGHPQNSKPVN
jgi:hypothetical protein